MFEKIGSIIYDHWSLGPDTPWLDVSINSTTNEIQFTLLNTFPPSLASGMEDPTGFFELENIRLVLDAGKSLPVDPLIVTMYTLQSVLTAGVISNDEPIIWDIFGWWENENPQIGDFKVASYSLTAAPTARVVLVKNGNVVTKNGNIVTNDIYHECHREP